MKPPTSAGLTVRFEVVVAPLAIGALATTGNAGRTEIGPPIGPPRPEAS